MQVDSEVLCRKRALFILQHSVQDRLTPREAWHTFFLLYNVLEEFAPYLIQVGRIFIFPPKSLSFVIPERAKAYGINFFESLS